MKNFFLVLLFLSPLSALPQGNFTYRAQPLLAQGEVQHYLKTFKDIVFEIDELKIENESISLIGFLQEQKSNKEITQIFQKYGWSRDYIRKWTVIDLGFKEIEAAKNVEYEISQGNPAFKSIDPQSLYGRVIHPEDSKKIQPFYTQLQQLKADAEDW